MTVPGDELITSTLYQFDAADPPPNHYEPTGQGFTGLVYSSNPATGSDLQFYCSTVT